MTGFQIVQNNTQKLNEYIKPELKEWRKMIYSEDRIIVRPDISVLTLGGNLT